MAGRFDNLKPESTIYPLFRDYDFGSCSFSHLGRRGDGVNFFVVSRTLTVEESFIVLLPSSAYFPAE
jgi:hypothetical protein